MSFAAEPLCSLVSKNAERYSSVLAVTTKILHGTVIPHRTFLWKHDKFTTQQSKDSFAPLFVCFNLHFHPVSKQLHRSTFFLFLLPTHPSIQLAPNHNPMNSKAAAKRCSLAGGKEKSWVYNPITGAHLRWEGRLM